MTDDFDDPEIDDTGASADWDDPEIEFDPFRLEDELGIHRDRWGRPLILPDPTWLDRAKRRGRVDVVARIEASNGWPDGRIAKHQMADGRRPFVRASTVAKSVDPSYGLGYYFRRMGLLAIARCPDLLQQLATMSYADGRAIDALADRAIDRMGNNREIDPEGKLIAANRGTTFHRLTTPEIIASLGDDPVYGPMLREYMIPADNLMEKLDEAELEIVASENFSVNDRLGASGTYDHLVRDMRTGLVHVLDSKTGQMQWISHETQIETYTTAKAYDPKTGIRSPLHEDIGTDIGFIAAADLRTGEVGIFEVDLDRDISALAIDVWRAQSTERHRYRLRA